MLFTLTGIGYTLYSEITNVRIKGTWGYTEVMPILPILLDLMRLLRPTPELPA